MLRKGMSVCQVIEEACPDLAGFEVVDLLEGTLMTVHQLEEGRAEVENQYPRVVQRDGNRAAQELINKVRPWFQPKAPVRRTTLTAGTWIC